MIRTVAICLLLAAAPLHASERPPRPERIDAELWGRLLELDRRAGAVEDLTAEFTQHRHTALLREPLVSSGRVVVRGSRMRWDTHRPRPTRMLVTSEHVWIHYVEQELVEVYRVDERLGELAGSPLPRLAVLLRHFEMEPAEVDPLVAAAPPLEEAEREAARIALKLTPRDEALRDHLESLHLLLDVERACARRFVMLDPDGERTVVTFHAVRTDHGVEAGALDLELAPGTRVVRPLEAQRP